MTVYKYRLVHTLWFSIKTGKTINDLIYQDYAYKHGVNLLFEDFMFLWCSFACSLGLWELDREKGDAAKRDGGFELIRCWLVGAIRLLGRAAPTGRGLLKFLSTSIAPAALLDGCSPRWLLQSQASNLKGKCPKTKGKKWSNSRCFVALPSFAAITAGSLCLPHLLWHSETLCASCTTLPLEPIQKNQDTSKAPRTSPSEKQLSSLRPFLS